MTEGDQPGGTQKRVFVVEANYENNTKMVRMLSRVYAVQGFADGKEALDAMYENAPDVVIIDERTLNTKGNQILTTKRAEAKLKSVPFIVLGQSMEGYLYGSDDDEDSAPDYYIKKPFSTNRLFEQIAFSMSRSVEKKWEKIEEAPRKTLQSTVQEFQNLTMAIERGDPVDLDSSKKSCEPLVECVANHQFSSILDNVRDHHNYTYVHSLRVATFLSVFGHAIGIRGDDLVTLSTGGLLHDVGKMVTPQEVLNKPGRLEGDEWVVMKSHVEHSGEILRRSPDLNPIVRIIAEQHHEKLDGTGYPLGLKGDQLNELARMAAIVDIFGALTDERSYKPAFPPEKAFAILEDIGDGLDQRLVKKFREILEST